MKPYIMNIIKDFYRYGIEGSVYLKTNDSTYVVSYDKRYGAIISISSGCNGCAKYNFDIDALQRLVL